MKKAIILHGKPSKEGYYDPSRQSQSNEHWLPWIQHELIIRDILAQTPEMPTPYEPNYEDWRQTFETFGPDADTALVGHSAGGGFIVRWLSENKDKQVDKVVLVAPSLGLGWDSKNMYDFEIDPAISTRAKGITILIADDDVDGIQTAVRTLEETIKNIKVRRLNKGGHFTFKDMGKREFLELLEELMGSNE